MDIMKTRLIAIVTIYILIVAGLFGFINFSSWVTKGYNMHDPIRINNDADFAMQVGIEGWAGNGINNDPYIIENLEIDGQDGGTCLYIGNTSVYFIVRNCLLYNTTFHHVLFDRGTGITLNNVENGILSNNTCNDHTDGIYLSESHNNQIIENNCSSNIGSVNCGIKLSQSNFNIIKNNTLQWNVGGISLYFSDYNILMNNTCIGGDDNGIYLSNSNYNTFRGNECNSNDIGGFYISQNNLGNTIENNECSSNGRGGILLYIGSHGSLILNNTCNSNGQYGIYIEYCNGHTLRNNTCSYNGYDGFRLYYSEDNTLTYNTCTYNNQWDVGFDLRNSANNTIRYNNISYNQNVGLALHSESSNCIVTDNICIGNSQTGIWVHSSTNVTVENNTSNHNERGITLNSNANNNTVFNNICNWNDWYGIYIASSTNITLIHNNFSSNAVTGIDVWGADDNHIHHNDIFDNQNYAVSLNWQSQENLFYGNNFINNGATMQIWDEGGNVWNESYPIGGNYWSDYSGSDFFSGPNQDEMGSDGVGDAPYTDLGGSSGSVDFYPLINPAVSSIFLHKGWNLISVPTVQTNTNPSAVLSSINDLYDAVQWYNTTDNSDHWKHNHSSKPSHLNDLEIIDHTMGFWIHVTEEDGTVFTFKGTRPIMSQNISLHQGWNLIGYPSSGNKNRTKALNNIIFGADIDLIQAYDAETKTWKMIEDLDFLVVGKGYWIHSLVEKIWEVPV